MGGRRCPRVRGGDGLRRARRAAPARRRRVRLPARGVRSAARLPHRLDLVRGRLQRGHRGRRGRLRHLPRPPPARGGRHGTVGGPAPRRRHPHRLAPSPRGPRRHRRPDRRPPRRAGARPGRAERAGGDEGGAACGLHRARLHPGPGLGRELRGDRRGGDGRRLAARAAAGHVRVLGLERRVVSRRGDPRPRPQRAARPGSGNRRGGGDLRAVEPAVRLRPARHRVRRRRPHGRRGGRANVRAGGGGLRSPPPRR